MSNVKDKTLVDFTPNQLRDFFKKAGLSNHNIEKAIEDYQRYREVELSSLEFLDTTKLRAEAIAKKVMSLRDGGEIVEEILKNYLRLLDYKKEIVESYEESKNWDKVITTAVYSDIPEAQESFIDYVEEIYLTKIKDGKHLQELTGITEETLEGLEETVINAKFCKYFRALEIGLKLGLMYKDLLKIKPQDFNLPKSWRGCLGSDQYSSILWAISETFRITEPGFLCLAPGLRTIAEEIQAPYSVLMDCYNLTNRGIYGATGN